MLKYILLSAMLWINTCSKMKKTLPAAKEETSLQKEQQETAPCSELRKGEIMRGNLHAYLSIEKISQNGDALLLDVRYTGCADDTFDLVWNGAAAKSLPPQTTVEIQRVETDKKPCREEQRKQLCYQLSALKPMGAVRGFHLHFTQSQEDFIFQWKNEEKK
ncbi:MAG: hypothetical protein IPL35_03270 [Sphingobacteriales bacterium]|nr:hypothetical protein [Sphingobacteriales bacterium]